MPELARKRSRPPSHWARIWSAVARTDSRLARSQGTKAATSAAVGEAACRPRSSIVSAALALRPLKRMRFGFFWAGLDREFGADFARAWRSARLETSAALIDEGDSVQSPQCSFDQYPEKRSKLTSNPKETSIMTRCASLFTHDSLLNNQPLPQPPTIAIDFQTALPYRRPSVSTSWP